MPNAIHIDEVEGTGGQELHIHVMDAERGPQGEQGEPGQAATIEAGNAYTVATDARPAVMNVGTDTNAKFDFYIPKGEKGEQGEPGVVQYKAGRGIYISKDNTITATGGGGGGGGAWGEIVGNIEDQTDLQAEFDNYTPTANLATVATSGSYNDLTNKPTIPAAQVQSDWNQSNSSAVDYIKNKPSIPVVPTVNDATLTIQQNGTNVATFTANSSTNATANITAPTITMTSTDPGQGSALAANNFVGVYGADPIILDYSTSEINTGAKWVDGKTIYKKTVYGHDDFNSNVMILELEVENFEKAIKIEGIAHSLRSTSKEAYVVPYNDNNHRINLYVAKSGSAYIAHIFTDSTYWQSELGFYITVYYTKSS